MFAVIGRPGSLVKPKPGAACLGCSPCNYKLKHLVATSAVTAAAAIAIGMVTDTISTTVMFTTKVTTWQCLWCFVASSIEAGFTRTGLTYFPIANTKPARPVATILASFAANSCWAGDFKLKG